MSSAWSLRRRSSSSGNKYFVKNDVSSNSYQFINSELFSALESLEHKPFDLIFCHDSLEQHDISRFFSHVQRLQPKQLILDTGMVSGEGPLVQVFTQC